MHHYFYALPALASLVSAHFELQWPPTGVEFNEDTEPNAPCGGVATEPSDSTVDLTVDQFAVSIRSSHPEGHWSFNIANSTSPPFNWTSITNIVETQGVGDFCLPALSIPAEYAGSSGVLQIIDNASDGMLYQCAPVNFVEGSNSTIGPACTNSSGFTASYTDQQSSSGHADDGHSHDMASGTMSMSDSASATAEGASSSASEQIAAMATGFGTLAGGLGLLAAGLAL